ncbi:hypothetical protein PENTCL1PPCAC_16102, partial [Pristionchus entomophagus]
RFNGENGLVVTSIVSYIFYTLYFVNNLTARYFDVLFCGYVQWLFLGLSSITPFWCLLLFTPTVRNGSGNEALEIFDYCQTIIISTCLLVTIPLACFVYCKLLFVRPFSGNYTFKLIVTNGVAQILQCVMYLINFQLTTYPFMYNYYISIQRLGIMTPLIVINNLLDGLSLHTMLFVALNRMKTILFLRRRSVSSLIEASSSNTCV